MLVVCWRDAAEFIIVVVSMVFFFQLCDDYRDLYLSIRRQRQVCINHRLSLVRERQMRIRDYEWRVGAFRGRE